MQVGACSRWPTRTWSGGAGVMASSAGRWKSGSSRRSAPGARSGRSCSTSPTRGNASGAPDQGCRRPAPGDCSGSNVVAMTVWTCPRSWTSSTEEVPALRAQGRLAGPGLSANSIGALWPIKPGARTSLQSALQASHSERASSRLMAWGSLAVEPQHRSRGLGARLLDAAESEARAPGLPEGWCSHV